MRHAAPSGPPIADRSARRCPTGFHLPQQARSRAALQRLLASAQHVLVTEGLEELTIARVAEHAGVSVGGVYRRFAGKEQLIDAVKHAFVERLEHNVAAALDNADPSLGGVVDAFTAALSETLDESGRLIPVMLAGGRGADPRRKGCARSPACSSGSLTPRRLTGNRSVTRIPLPRLTLRFAA